MKDDTWQLGDRKFLSRIIVGTGKYSSLDETKAALDTLAAAVRTARFASAEAPTPSASI